MPCVAEAPVLIELKRRGVTIDAIAIRDRPEDVAAFLARHGDPFDRIGSDDRSQVQIALGSSGVPESFVIDGRGIIRAQHIGPIMAQDVPAILAALEAARMKQRFSLAAVAVALRRRSAPTAICRRRAGPTSNCPTRRRRRRDAR